MGLFAETASLWARPGVSEVTAALLGAAFGALASGWVSWLLQRNQFREERKVRSAERDSLERSHLFEALYQCLQASSDLWKFAQSVSEAARRLPGMQAPPVDGVRNNWVALIPHATLPRPIAIDPRALSPLVEQKEADLLMGVLDLQAAHDAQLKLWETFADRKKSLGEKTSVRMESGQTYTTIDSTMLQKLYPQLKEISDLADGIFQQAPDMALQARKTTKRLAAFIERYCKVKTDLVWPEDGETPSPVGRQGQGSKAS